MLQCSNNARAFLLEHTICISARSETYHRALPVHTYTSLAVWPALVSISCLLGPIGSKCPNEQTAETDAGCVCVCGLAEQDGASCSLLRCIWCAEQGTLSHCTLFWCLTASSHYVLTVISTLPLQQETGFCFFTLALHICCLACICVCMMASLFCVSACICMSLHCIYLLKEHVTQFAALWHSMWADLAARVCSDAHLSVSESVRCC